MNIAYSVDEVFEIAEQIERNGAAFYRKAAEGAGREEARGLFTSLAEQEDQHERTFAGLRQKLVPAGAAVSVYDRDDVVAIYLQALADRQVFRKDQDIGDVLSGAESLVEVLNIAMEKERDSILYYCGVRDIMDTDEQKHAIEQVIRQEQKHLDDLAAELERAGAAADQ